MYDIIMRRMILKNALGRTKIDPFRKSPNSAEPKFGRAESRIRHLASVYQKSNYFLMNFFITIFL